MRGSFSSGGGAEEAALFFADRKVEFFHDEEHVFPHFAFVVVGAGAEEIGGVVGGEEGDVFEGEPTSAQGAHRFVGAGEAEHGGFAEGDEDAGLDDGDLLAEVGQAALHFKRGGRAVAGGALGRVGAAFEDVGEVDVVAGEAHGGDDFGEEFAGASDEGFAEAVFVCPGGFADKHEVGVRVAGAEDGLGAGGGEVLALLAGADGFAKRGESRFAGHFRFQIGDFRGEPGGAGDFRFEIWILRFCGRGCPSQAGEGLAGDAGAGGAEEVSAGAEALLEESGGFLDGGH